MSDVLDEVIDMLPPATVRLILESDKNFSNHGISLNNLLHDFQQIKLRQTDREFKRKIADVKSKTAENRNYLIKLKKELEVLNSLKEPKSNTESMRAYATKICELEAQIKNLTSAHGDIDLSQLFNEVEDLNQQIEEHKKKISEARSQYECYDNFPADVEQGKEVIAKMKERIKQRELAVEALF